MAVQTQAVDTDKLMAFLGQVIGEAVSRFRDEVAAGTFPDEEHSYS